MGPIPLRFGNDERRMFLWDPRVDLRLEPFTRTARAEPAVPRRRQVGALGSELARMLKEPTGPLGFRPRSVKDSASDCRLRVKTSATKTSTRR